MQQLALVRRDVDGRQAGRVGRLERGVERRVAADQRVVQVVIDRGPQLLNHGPVPFHLRRR
jgi:hypothetical protein